GINGQTVQANAEKTIGIAGADAYDVARAQTGANIKALAFKSIGQKFAYYPDSTSSAKDKKNARDGHYPVWGYVHVIGPKDGSGAPTGKLASFLGFLLTGIASGGNAFDALDVQIDNGLVPVCAMQVQRSEEMGPLSPFTAASSCACYFDKKTTGA